jgi:UDPglucose--hexose-1-phosphate uridylyltransferase
MQPGDAVQTLDLNEHPHRRYNPLTDEWVLVSPHRTKRPWVGQVEKAIPDERPEYDPECYLCPGNRRASGARNPDYAGTFVFDNDFAALLPEKTSGHQDTKGLLVARSERGLCRVICFSPRHDLTLAEMEQQDVRLVVDTWVDQYRNLGELRFVRYVQIFENKGAVMGCSNPHPHGQIWASESLPNEPHTEERAQKSYMRSHGTCLLCNYLALEEKESVRIVCSNAHFVALVPFWAVWPFDTMLISKRHAASLEMLNEDERDGLADIIRRLTIRYDNLFETSFPYSMGFHQRPTDGNEHAEWHLHAHFYPPLLRSATVKKFMVGYEMLGTPQRDITPEDGADRLRKVSEVHYKGRFSGA